MTRPIPVHVELSPGDVALVEALKRLRAERAQPLPATFRPRRDVGVQEDSPEVTARRRESLLREVTEYEQERGGRGRKAGPA